MLTKKLGLWLIGLGGIIFVFLFVWSFFSNELWLIITCITFLLVFNVGFALLPIKKPYTHRKRWALFYLITGLILLALTFLLKYYHIPRTDVWLIESIFFLCFAYTPLLIKNRYQKWQDYTDNRVLLLLLCIGDLISLISILLGGLFIFQRWPGAYFFIICGGIVFGFTLFGWNQVIKYIVKRRKEAEEKANEALKEITASIRYAKRIQTSLLPTDKYIGRILDKKN